MLESISQIFSARATSYDKVCRELTLRLHHPQLLVYRIRLTVACLGVAWASLKASRWKFFAYGRLSMSGVLEVVGA